MCMVFASVVKNGLYGRLISRLIENGGQTVTNTLNGGLLFRNGQTVTNTLNRPNHIEIITNTLIPLLNNFHTN